MCLLELSFFFFERWKKCIGLIQLLRMDINPVRQILYMCKCQLEFYIGSGAYTSLWTALLSGELNE